MTIPRFSNKHRSQEIFEILSSFEVDRLIKMMAMHAKKKHDGHFAIFSFTTGYKVAFGTPDLDSAQEIGMGRKELLGVRSHRKLKDALVHALLSEASFGLDEADR